MIPSFVNRERVPGPEKRKNMNKILTLAKIAISSLWIWGIIKIRGALKKKLRILRHRSKRWVSNTDVLISYVHNFLVNLAFYN